MKRNELSIVNEDRLDSWEIFFMREGMKKQWKKFISKIEGLNSSGQLFDAIGPLLEEHHNLLYFEKSKRQEQFLESLGWVLRSYEGSSYDIEVCKRLLFESIKKAGEIFPKDAIPVLYTTQLMPSESSFSKEIWAQLSSLESFEIKNYGRISLVAASKRLIKEKKVKLLYIKFLPNVNLKDHLVFALYFKLTDTSTANDDLNEIGEVYTIVPGSVEYVVRPTGVSFLRNVKNKKVRQLTKGSLVKQCLDGLCKQGVTIIPLNMIKKRNSQDAYDRVSFLHDLNSFRNHCVSAGVLNEATKHELLHLDYSQNIHLLKNSSK